MRTKLTTPSTFRGYVAVTLLCFLTLISQVAESAEKEVYLTHKDTSYGKLVFTLPEQVLLQARSRWDSDVENFPADLAVLCAKARAHLLTHRTNIGAMSLSGVNLRFTPRLGVASGKGSGRVCFVTIEFRAEQVGGLPFYSARDLIVVMLLDGTIVEGRKKSETDSARTEQ